MELTASPMSGSSDALKHVIDDAKTTTTTRPASTIVAAESAASAAANSVSGSPSAGLFALLPRVVVTGVACGLPGQAKVFEEDNLARLLGGQGCLEMLSAGSMSALVEKNVVQVCTIVCSKYHSRRKHTPRFILCNCGKYGLLLLPRAVGRSCIMTPGDFFLFTARKRQSTIRHVQCGIFALLQF